jgi:lipopolysaccharide biosynthesis glycosyltransferase
MDVVYCFDDRYARPAVVSARSLLRWSPTAKVHFLHQQASSATVAWMKERLPENAAFYDVGARCWATDSYESHITHISKATNLRLCAPEVLPLSVQKVIYLDADTLVFADLSSYVAAFPVAESGFAARKGGAMSSNTWGRGLFPKAAPPLVAGVLFMDLQKLRELGFCNACRRILSNVGPANDQTVINLWCRGVFGQLPPELNMRADEASGTAQPRVLHYEGANGKPWEASYCGPLKDFWKAHADSAELPLVRLVPELTIEQVAEEEEGNDTVREASMPLSPERQRRPFLDLHAAAAAGARAGAIAGARAGAVSGAEAGARAAAEGGMDIDLHAMVLLGESMAQGLWSEQVIPEEEEETIPHLLQEDPSDNNPQEEGQEALMTDDHDLMPVVIDLPGVPLDLGSEE